MRVLAVSDVVNKLLYSPQVRRIAGDVDLIISCGDLPSYYLDFLVSSLGKPLFYVCGNHDKYGVDPPSLLSSNDHRDFFSSHFNYDKSANFGGINLHGKSESIGDKVFSGLEGSILYNHGSHQYSDRQMRRTIRRSMPQLYLNRMKTGRYLDVLVTHAPPKGIHDLDDRAHRGFSSFLWYMEKFRPKYLLHGHIHLYDLNIKRESQYFDTTVINCYDYQLLNLEI